MRWTDRNHNSFRWLAWHLNRYQANHALPLSYYSWVTFHIWHWKSSITNPPLENTTTGTVYNTSGYMHKRVLKNELWLQNVIKAGMLQAWTTRDIRRDLRTVSVRQGYQVSQCPVHAPVRPTEGPFFVGSQQGVCVCMCICVCTFMYSVSASARRGHLISHHHQCFLSALFLKSVSCASTIKESVCACISFTVIPGPWRTQEV